MLFEAEDGNFWILLQARDAKPDSPPTLTAKYDIAESPTKSSESKDDIIGGLLSVRHKKGDKSKKKKTCYRYFLCCCYSCMILQYFTLKFAQQEIGASVVAQNLFRTKFMLCEKVLLKGEIELI